MKFLKIILVAGLLASTMFANEFINYDKLSESLKNEAKKNTGS
jgi:hypothetical protein